MRNPTRLVSLGGVGGQHLSELCVKVKFNRPYTRLPFDELITTQQFVIDCIENNFEPYHQLNVLIGNLYTTPSRNAFYTNGAINRDKINETINNFYALLNSNKKIIFLRSEAHVHITSKSYLDIFDERVDEVGELKKQYRAGGLGDVVVKKRLIEVLQNLVRPIRERREELAKDTKANIKECCCLI